MVSSYRLPGDFLKVGAASPVFAHRCYAGKLVPDQVVPACGTLSDDDKKIVDLINGLPGLVDHEVQENIDFHKALKAVWEVLSELNRYVTQQQPWVLVRENPERLRTVLYVMIESIRVIAMCIFPVMPSKATLILDQLGIPAEFRSGDAALVFGILPAGLHFGSNRDILFPKVDTGKEPKRNPKKTKGKSEGTEP